MDKTLIICGPTATGKTRFGLKIGQLLSGELISADSRQVYIDMDIVTGKDIPSGVAYQLSDLLWKDRYLKYYEFGGSKIWLYDIVYPNEPFNVSFWHHCANLCIRNITSRKKLPIIVGGTGLYIKSLTHSLDLISIPVNQHLRNQIEKFSVPELFLYLSKVDPYRAANLNLSDRSNPRRLVRAIEIALSPSQPDVPTPQSDTLILGLTAPKSHLYSLVDQRISSRLASGAMAESAKLALKYSPLLPSMAACGYSALLSASPETNWQASEHSLVRRQLTWFKAQPNVHWFDISTPTWENSALRLVTDWYNES